MTRLILRIALAAATALAACPALAQQRLTTPVARELAPAEVTLEDQFRDPPGSARPRVWWHWMSGKVAGTVWHAPFRLDISGAARAGRNRLSVRVANPWVNRLIGPVELLGQGRYCLEPDSKVGQ